MGASVACSVPARPRAGAQGDRQHRRRSRQLRRRARAHRPRIDRTALCPSRRSCTGPEVRPTATGSARTHGCSSPDSSAPSARRGDDRLATSAAPERCHAARPVIGSTARRLPGIMPPGSPPGGREEALPDLVSADVRGAWLTHALSHHREHLTRPRRSSSGQRCDPHLPGVPGHLAGVLSALFRTVSITGPFLVIGEGWCR